MTSRFAASFRTYTSISNHQADRWGELCSGSPRVAHVIGENLVNHPEDLLKPPGTVTVWERYVAAGDDQPAQKLQLSTADWCCNTSRFLSGLALSGLLPKKPKPSLKRLKQLIVTSLGTSLKISSMNSEIVKSFKASLHSISHQRHSIFGYGYSGGRDIYRLFDLEDFTRRL